MTSTPSPAVHGASPTLQRRVLATELKKLRNSAGLTHVDVTNQLGWPQAKLSKIESAKQGVSVDAVMALAEICRATPEQREVLVRMAHTARQRAWWAAYSDVLPMGRSTYVGLETAAELVWIFSTESVPDLLRTPRYADAMLRAQRGATESVVERKLALLLDRQRLLFEHTAGRKQVVLSEAALRRVVGDAELLGEQLAQLVELAADDKVALRVLPFEAGALPIDTPFTLMRFEQQLHPDVAFVAGRHGYACYADEDVVEAYWCATRELEELCLSSEDSVRLVRSVAGCDRHAALREQATKR